MKSIIECAQNYMKASTSIGRLRLVGFIEGVSYITLLGIAMPLKYFADKPEYVRINGMIHGVLFIILCLLILIALIEGKLSFKWAVLAFIATLIPFGTFVIDRKLAFFDKE